MRTTKKVDPEQVAIDEQVNEKPVEAPANEDHVEPEVPAVKPAQKDSLLKKGADKLMEMEEKRLQKKEAKEQKKAAKAEAKAAKKAEKNDTAGTGKGLKIAAGVAGGLVVLGAIGKAIMDANQGNANLQEVSGEPLMLDDGNTIIEEPSVEEPVPETNGNNEEDLTESN